MTLATALRLCRIPNVFTAFANVIAGTLLARGGRFEPGDVRLVLASGLLYCSGMVLNDYFDREIDARERPERPIPSGAVSARTAATLGFAMMAAGVALCATVSRTSFQLGLGLAAAILVYDAITKGTRLGPLAMGSCRFLNVLLGLSAGSAWSRWMWVAPLTMGAYTAIITYLARDEVGGSSRARARNGVTMMAVLVVACCIGLATVAPARGFPGCLGAIALLGFVMIRGRSLFSPLLRDTSGPTIGRAIGGGILLMPAIDATMVAGAGHLAAALAVLALSLPAYAFKRLFYVT
jgi:4-hydroxybenzoate polyprenyltransferase